MVITDEEARAYYLPGVPARPQTLPESMLDDGNLESLQILQHPAIDRRLAKESLPAA